MALSESPVVPLYSLASRRLVNPRLGGWYDNPRDIHPLRYLHLARISKVHEVTAGTLFVAADLLSRRHCIGLGVRGFVLVRLTPGGPFDGERQLPEAVEKNLRARLPLGRTVSSAIRSLHK